MSASDIDADTTPDDRFALVRPGTLTVAIGLVVFGLFLFWDLNDAGTRETDWLPGALLAAFGVLSLVLGAGGLPRRLGRAELVALASLGGLTAWAFASIAWAGVQGDAWTGANRALLYLGVFTLFVLLPWRASPAATVLCAYVLGTSIVAALAVERAASDVDRFIDGRLSYPTGYPNANAALFLSAFWIALVLATRRSIPVPVRVAAGAAAAFLPQAAMLSQSRGSGVSFVATGVVLIVLLPGRLRTAAGIAGATTLVALTWGTHAAVFDAAFVGGADLRSAIGRSGAVMTATSAAAALVVLAWAIVDRRVELSPRAQRLVDRAAAAAAALLVIGILAGVVASHPVARVEQAWTNFTAVDATNSSRPHFSLGIGSNRHDFWRVAVSRFEDRPLTGIGADNFAVDYMRDRRSIEEPAYPHSLPVMVLSQLGIVGAALFASFLVSIGVATVPRRSDDPGVAAVGGAAVAGAVYFFVHASVDWFWEIPALGAPAMALMGLAAGVRATSGAEVPAGRRLPRVALAAIAAVTVVAAASCAFPWLAQRQIDRATAVWRTNPAEAYDLLSSARALNPLSAKPDLVAGVIAARLDDTARMPALFTSSLERNPLSWYAQLELGLSQSVNGRPRAAIAAVRRAIALNPREPVLQDIERRLEKGEKVSPSSLDALFLERIEARTR